eukprot:352869-Chlamydomonas_euryale.AAC.10
MHCPCCFCYATRPISSPGLHETLGTRAGYKTTACMTHNTQTQLGSFCTTGEPVYVSLSENSVDVPGAVEQS